MMGTINEKEITAMRDLLERKRKEEAELLKELDRLEEELEKVKAKNDVARAEMDQDEERLRSEIEEIDTPEFGKLWEVQEEIEVLDRLLEKEQG